MRTFARDLGIDMESAFAADPRFWEYVNRGEGCWLWTGARFRQGYGHLRRGNRDFSAHRYSWGLAVGAIPTPLYVCHECDVKLCVRPEHLYLATHRQNSIDAGARGLMGRGDQRGERSTSALLRENDVRHIRAAVASGCSQRELAREYGVHFATINAAVRRKTWGHI